MARNDPPRLVTILANAGCPHCVHAAETLTDWCSEMGIPVAGIDVTQHREVADELDIEQSPAVVYEAAGARRVLPGFPSHDEFVRLTSSR